MESKFKQVLAATSTTLKAAGFTKRGTSFRRKYDDNIAIIDFQKSTDNSAQALKFTINLGVISSKLLSRWDPEKLPSKQTVWEAPLRERIGTLAYGEDRWWTVTSNEPVSAIENEVTNLIETCAVPFLDQHQSDNALIAMWKRGNSPGLTEGQRVRNLSLLEGAN
ncbi:hypothetical protein BXU08_00960 [Sphingomonas sp. LM7]|nr:hypothetical protein BXU08_00960 [Sphingomonas sp. LM7]